MKNLFTKFISTLLIAACTLNLAYAQNRIAAEGEDIAPYASQGINQTGSNEKNQALWDILYNHNLMAITSQNGNAAVCFTGTEYWISRWANDTIIILDATGALVSKINIAGVTGVRSFTYDGTHIYAGVNTASIKKIDPTTQTLVGTITAPIPLVRSLCYDPTANGGAGGFWASTWDTDIRQFSMTGINLDTVLAVNHFLTGMYGTSFDNYSPGGPYLWVFDQTFGFGADLVQINIASGFQTGIFHDVNSDVMVAAGDTSGLAGGVYVYPQPGSLQIIGVLQGSPTNRLFAYDLDVAVGLNQLSAPEEFVTVQPNPATSQINISINKNNNALVDLQIFDALGNKVFDKKTRGLNNYINVSGYKPGVYYTKVTYNGEMFTSRFVKK